ncbi:neural cell adhesion molecule 2-like isoform X2 [Xyrauchen texanus]|uniref:neural cell adhesion molecule 2-like isoform X2 n=1 Tax=Xyrauchen texanus TaxID=154827 RepID=UPI0022423685|nr:neural cell adhesion molecule 2-like isoform X2 [Xyrauchen texanus]
MTAAMIILRLCMLLLINIRLTDAKVEMIAGNPDVPIGNDFLLLCKADTEGDFNWEKDNEDIDNDRYLVKHVDELSSKLTLKDVQLDDSGVYTCMFENDQGKQNNTYRIYVYQTPDFGTTSTYHEFLVNQTVKVPCVVSGKPEVEVHWYKNDRIVNDDGRGHVKILPDNSLEIVEIQQKDRGTYTCEGRIKGRPISRTLQISVVVNEPPTVLFHQERKSVSAGPDNSVSIICLVKGEPTPNITWITPSPFDNTRYKYNSDRSELTISAVTRSDSGEYVCMATNKIGENSATFILDVSGRPTVVLDKSRLTVIPGEAGSVVCNATGHPTPTIQWIRKTSQEKISRVEGSELILKNVMPSDGGLYSCIANNTAGTTTKDFQLITWPGTPTKFSVALGSSSSVLIQSVSVQDGGSPITQYILQWKKPSQDNWSQSVVEPSGPLVIKALETYTEYLVRFAAKNSHYQGNFTAEQKIVTQSQREPNSPVLSLSEKLLEKNSVSIPIKQQNYEGSPILHYVVRYKADNEEWKEKEMPGNSSRIHLSGLQYNSDYQMEVIAINHNGSSSMAKVKFTVPQPVYQPGVGKAGVVGIVIVILLVLMVSVDVFCCYTNHCGLLNFLARKLFGHQVANSKDVDEEANNSNGKKPGYTDPTTEA